MVLARFLRVVLAEAEVLSVLKCAMRLPETFAPHPPALFSLTADEWVDRWHFSLPASISSCADDTAGMLAIPHERTAHPLSHTSHT